MNNVIEQILKDHPLDIAVTEPNWDNEKANYKKVFNWNTKPIYDPSNELNGHQLIIRPTDEYAEIDWDIFKHLPDYAARIKSDFPTTLEFGRDGKGHSLYKVINIPTNPESIFRAIVGQKTLLEYRGIGTYAVFKGPLDKDTNADVTANKIHEIDYSKLKKMFNKAVALAALLNFTTDTTGVINNFLQPTIGEFYSCGVSEEDTHEIFEKWSKIIGREDRKKENTSCIKGIYKSGKASNIFSKTYPLPFEEKEKKQFRELIKRLSSIKEEEDKGQSKQTEKLVVHCLHEYMKLPIQKPKFLVERLIKENSINWVSGPKGNGKSEYILGLTHSLCRGVPFLNYKCPVPMPVLYVDGEMDPYDLIERAEAYIEKMGMPLSNYFNIMNFALQEHEVIPDIKDELGQRLILEEAKIIETATGKRPIIVLDNLRSLSNYKENDSDEFRLINSWLLALRAKRYTSLIVDHHGKAVGGGPRGTSTKTDNANLSILINSVREKGNPNMVMKVAFDKARGLRPDETEEYEAVYDFHGGWIAQEARGTKNDDDICKKIKETRESRAKAEKTWQIKLDEDLKKGSITKEAYTEICKNHKTKYTQKELAEQLDISVGKLNKLLKAGGTYDQYCSTAQDEDVF
tara:strand:+ start:883 stop:2772 length:1890 start_codon:yes stop_codon:yes gene_type:complete